MKTALVKKDSKLKLLKTKLPKEHHVGTTTKLNWQEPISVRPVHLVPVAVENAEAFLLERIREIVLLYCTMANAYV